MDTFANLFPSVHDQLGLKEALGKLAQCERQVKSQGVLSILDNVNILYSCIVNASHLKDETIDELFNIIIKSLQLLENELKKVLVERIVEETRLKYCSLVKILTCLAVELATFVEKKICKEAANDLLSSSTLAGAKKNTKRKKKTDHLDGETGAFDWILVKNKVLDALLKVLMQNIQKLWNPPIVEEQFVTLITNMCYRFFENSQIKTTKSLKESLCHVLSIMIKKYNHGYGACVMIIQTITHYDHLSNVYAELVETCVTQVGYESILADLLRELNHHMSSLSNGTAAASGGGGGGATTKTDTMYKYYSQLLTELGERMPKHLLNHLALIHEYLSEDSYMIRNAALYIFGELICKVLTEQLTQSDLKMKKIRNDLLNALCDHMHDVNALVRSRSLQIWRKIVEEKMLPLSYQNEIMMRCVGRMEDVASGVRKSAFQLLCDLIKNNPYGIKSIKCSMTEIEKELTNEKRLLKEMKTRKSLEEQEEAAEADAEMSALLNESQAMDVECTRTSSTTVQEKKNTSQERIICQTTKVNYLNDMLQFLNQIETAIPKLSQLLFSKTQTDVIEVISFFVTCYEHGLVDMLFGIRKMLSLILYAEATVKEAVIDAYKRLYLNASNNSLTIAKHLIKLTQNLTICEYEALEYLIGAFAESGELDQSVIQILWEIFAMKNSAIKQEESIGALILLSMIIKKIPSKGKANFQALIDYGLNADTNLFKISETCKALANICSQANTKQLDLSESFKLLNSNRLFETLSRVLVINFTNETTNEWATMADSALNCIFKLADQPLIICESIVSKLISLIRPDNEKIIENDQIADDKDGQPINMLLIKRFVSFIGFLATKILIFLNTSVLCELKRRKAIKENLDNTKKKSGTNGNRRKSMVASRSGRRSMVNSFNNGDGTVDLQEEMGLLGAEAEDGEQRFVEDLLEKKFTKEGLLGKLIQIPIIIFKEQSKYNNEELQVSCSMALVRCMCLSREVCVENLQLLFTIMEKSTSELVRAQLIIGIGDLVYRFPNALEPWTANLYYPLRDKSVKVRTNCIRVLSHLILKEMIKTRGQMSEIALCIIDDDTRISTLAKVFFTELSKRNNGLVIYNALPDMISMLSESSRASETSNDGDRLNEASFHQIVTCLFSFIKKDKQCETLIEKLAHGFKQKTDDRKCRDLAFCLTKINITDSSLKKLFECYKWFEDKLCFNDISETFKNILKNARKVQTLKPETKKIIEEFEKKIEDTLQKGVNDENDETKDANNETGSDNSTATTRQTQKKNIQKKKSNSKVVKSTKGRKKRVETSSDESESD